MANSDANRVYVFVDVPNYSRGTANNFQINISKFKYFLEKKYGKVEKFFWYDSEAEIAVTPLLRCPFYEG